MAQMRVPLHELVEFCRQFAAMHKANVNILDILSTLTQQTDNDWFKEILGSVREDVELGRTLASTFSKFPADFSPFFIQMVRQGESEGTLDEVFNTLAHHLEREIGYRVSGRGAGVSSAEDFTALLDNVRTWVGSAVAFLGLAALFTGLLYYMRSLGILTGPWFPLSILLLAGVALVSLAIYVLRRAPRRPVRCSFCGKAEAEVGRMVAGEGVYICDSCLTAGVRQLRRPEEGVPREESESPSPKSPQAHRQQAHPRQNS